MFTLKVIYDKKSDYIFPDRKHEYGGTDLLQIEAFKHLMPNGYCDSMLRGLFYDLARIHAWKIEERTVLDITKEFD